MDEQCFFVVAIVLTGQFMCLQAHAPKWNHLSVTFPKFNALPMNEADAIKEGWTLIADNCIERSTPFVGKRYILKDEHATVIIYDVGGLVAGMQMAYKTELKEGKYGKYEGVFQHIKEKHGDYYYLTAYFTEPKNVCNTNVSRIGDVVGDKLVFLTGVNKHMDIPSLEEDLASTKWVLGRCFPGMGTHYWYDISKDMDCNDIFPAFLLYNRQGRLNAWGFVTDVQIPGKRVEHPPGWLLWAFFKSATKPQCFSKLKNRSTQHVYFTKVGWFTHRCLF